MSNIFIGLKKTCLGVLDKGERNKNNATGLKEGGGIEMSTTVLPFAMLAPSLFEYLPALLLLIVSDEDDEDEEALPVTRANKLPTALS